MVSHNQILSWDEIEIAAEASFNIWADHTRELEFAKKAWQKISAQGLASYINDLERTEVVFRFLALAEIYHGFCGQAFDEYIECTFMEWADRLELDKFIVGRCFEKLVGNSSVDLDSDYESALFGLVSCSREKIYNALVKGYKSESELFVALYKTNWPENYDENDFEADEDILNIITQEKSRAFAWLSNGCEPYL